MEILLSLLRTLIFVVATVAATVYVSRRIGRGRSLLWTGTTLLALYWLVLFGWTAYTAGSTAPNADLGAWVGWIGHLLPFFAALAYIWGVGQAAGFPSRVGAETGAVLGKGTGSDRAATDPVPQTPDTTPSQPTPVPDAPVSRFGVPASRTGATSGGTSPVPPTVGSPAKPSGETTPRPRWGSQPFPGPHAVPVVTTPSASSHLSPVEPPQPKGRDETEPRA